MMKGFSDYIEKLTLDNSFFRKVIYTAKYSQLVLMNLKPGDEIGAEIHEDGDQFFRFEKGEGKVIIDGDEYIVRDGSAIIVPAGSQHNVINGSKTEDLKLYTIYSPPHHKDGTVHRTKTEAESDNEQFDGQTTK